MLEFGGYTKMEEQKGGAVSSLPFLIVLKFGFILVKPSQSGPGSAATRDLFNNIKLNQTPSVVRTTNSDRNRPPGGDGEITSHVRHPCVVRGHQSLVHRSPSSSCDVSGATFMSVLWFISSGPSVLLKPDLGFMWVSSWRRVMLEASWSSALISALWRSYFSQFQIKY